MFFTLILLKIQLRLAYFTVYFLYFILCLACFMLGRRYFLLFQDKRKRIPHLYKVPLFKKRGIFITFISKKEALLGRWQSSSSRHHPGQGLSADWHSSSSFLHSLSARRGASAGYLSVFSLPYPG